MPFEVEVHPLSLSSRAYIERISKKYLPKKIEEYPKFDTPCDKSLVLHYDVTSP